MRIEKKKIDIDALPPDAARVMDAMHRTAGEIRRQKRHLFFILRKLVRLGVSNSAVREAMVNALVEKLTRPRYYERIHMLYLQTDPGGERHYIAGVPIHAGDPIRVLHDGKWQPARYEASWQGGRIMDAWAYLSETVAIPLMTMDTPVELP